MNIYPKILLQSNWSRYCLYLPSGGVFWFFDLNSGFQRPCASPWACNEHFCLDAGTTPPLVYSLAVEMLEDDLFVLLQALLYFCGNKTFRHAANTFYWALVAFEHPQWNENKRWQCLRSVWGWKRRWKVARIHHRLRALGKRFRGDIFQWFDWFDDYQQACCAALLLEHVLVYKQDNKPMTWWTALVARRQIK